VVNSSTKSVAVRDVAILGGGLAGLTLARQLKLARPATDVVVVERDEHPVPEAAFKVGESTAELASHYLGIHLGLREYLEERQLRKSGLRFYFSNAGNHDITQRAEIGVINFLPTRTYQVDRGRLENDLTDNVRSMGVEVHERTKVTAVTTADASHILSLDGRQRGEIAARWVVDTSGRPGIFKRKLGLSCPLPHDVNSAWFRLADKVDVGEFSSDPTWRAKYPAGFRWRSTTHFVGEGYWFWVIPLASGSTSFGLVADPAWHPLETYNTFDLLLAWLDEHEPQVATEIRRRRHLLQDFRAFKHFATDCSQLFSADRWSIVGESGRFLDPLYSIGSDVIAICNTLSTALITRDLDGSNNLAENVRLCREAFDLSFAVGRDIYVGQYGIFGAPHVFTAKLLWDSVSYYAVIALLFCHGKYQDLAFLADALPALRQVRDLNAQVQRRLHAAAANRLQEVNADDILAATGSRERDYTLLTSFTRDLVTPASDDVLRRRLSDNLKFLVSLADEVCSQAERTESLVPVG
jgi:flavin-dependent dehydrogenase